MKKLCENIEDIHIRGDIGQLSDIVRSMDMSLQNIADNTDKLTGYLVRYGASNRGAQYAKVVNTALSLRDELFDASIDLNEMQKQVVDYQNKVYRYEDMSQSASPPNAYLVTKHNVATDSSGVQFTRTDMVRLIGALQSYSQIVYDQTKSINHKKDDAGSIWLDTQYNDFAEFIDEVTKKIVSALKIYDEYVIYLNGKVKEL